MAGLVQYGVYGVGRVGRVGALEDQVEGAR
jgi:hypothetical protein